MLIRCAPNRYAMAWLATVDTLFWLPSRLLARVAGTVRRAGTSQANPGQANPGRPANDNVGAMSAKAANSNVPRRLA